MLVECDIMLIIHPQIVSSQTAAFAFPYAVTVLTNSCNLLHYKEQHHKPKWLKMIESACEMYYGLILLPFFQIVHLFHLYTAKLQQTN